MKKQFLRSVAAVLAALTAAASAAFVSFAEDSLPVPDFASPKCCTQEQFSRLNELARTHELSTTEDGLFTYRIDRDPHLCSVILEYHGEGGDIVIPDCTGCVRISQTVIDFSGREDITSVTHAGFPVFAYFNDKFQNCVNLESFTVCAGATDELLKCYYPDGLPEALGNGKKFRQRFELAPNKFEGCTSLKTVSLPYVYGNPEYPEYTTAYIGTECFKGCTALSEIALTGYMTVAEDAFLDCTALEKVVFNQYVQSIRDHALGYIKDADGNYQRCEGLTIYGAAGTIAETYAAENDIPFVAVVPEISGDINTDGMLDVSDAVLLARLCAEDSTVRISPNGLMLADVNSDGNITAEDVITVLKRIAKLA